MPHLIPTLGTFGKPILGDDRSRASFYDVCMDKHRRFYLREWREFRGLTQEQLGLRVNMTKGRISEIERGVRRYNESMINYFAEALSCEPWELIGRNPLIDPQPPANIFDYFEASDRSVVEALMKKKSA